MEEMDLDTIIRVHPEIVIVDELAHTNVEGSLNEKRWQDVITFPDDISYPLSNVQSAPLPSSQYSPPHPLPEEHCRAPVLSLQYP